jgi:hypothetical protein
MAKRGRPNHPAALLMNIAGSPEAKERFLTILDNLGGTIDIESALARLGIGMTMYKRWRSVFLRCTVQALEPRPVGRPLRQVPPEWKRIRDLEREVHELKRDLKLTRLREELALIMRGPAKKKKLPKAKPTETSATKPSSPPSSVIKRETPGQQSPTV